MLRVASRPRLFSWDHFDAQAPSNHDREENPNASPNSNPNRPDIIQCRSASTDDDVSDYRTCISMSRPTSMLFQTSHSFGLTNDKDNDDNDDIDDFVYIVSDDEGDDYKDSQLDRHTVDPIFSIKPTSNRTTSLLSVNQDTQFAIMSFLDLNGLKALTLTCRHFNQVLTGKLAENLKDISSFDEKHLDIHSTSRNAVWWNLMKQTWPSLQLDSNESLSSQSVNFVIQNLDDNNTRNAKTHPGGINYAAILSLSATHVPTVVDPMFFKPMSIMQVETFLNEQGMIIRRRRRSRIKSILYKSYELRVKLDDVKVPLREHLRSQLDHDKQDEIEDAKIQVIQYTGRVGVGDRSIRSNEPFPRPLESLPVFERAAALEASEEVCCSSYFLNLNHRGRKRSLPKERSAQQEHNYFSENMGLPVPSLSFLGRLRSCSKSSGSTAVVVEPQLSPRVPFRFYSSKTFHPFVSPTVINSSKRFMEIDLTPRSIAYFEISILPRDKSQEINTTNENEEEGAPANLAVNHLHPFMDNEGGVESSSSCVAIGISTKDFSPTVRMPGWDQHSFAYHSDDGGIFHSKGEMIRVYGPRYDVGDTVGCGVNYQNGGIFFTLNGDFLGYAWCNEKIVSERKEDLYPTVGVDSSNPISLNFGNKNQFVWDFPKFLATSQHNTAE